MSTPIVRVGDTVKTTNGPTHVGVVQQVLADKVQILTDIDMPAANFKVIGTRALLWVSDFEVVS